MSVGEKLLQLRKQHQLSQEELAKKLLVSRQTISLWETNQSLPTIENLIRLREIFDVRIDEILLDAEEGEPEPAPLQTMEYTLTPEDYQKGFQVYNESFFKRNRNCIIFGVLMLIFALAAQDFGIAFIFLSVFIIAMSLRNLKALNQQKANLPQHSSVFQWVLYEADFAVSIHRDGVLTQYVRCRYGDILQAWRYEDRIALLIKNTIYLLPAAPVTADSPLLPAVQQKLVSKNSKTNLEKWTQAFFWFTIASLFFSAWIALLLPDFYGGFLTDYMWLMWLALPVPIACIVLGFVAKNRGLKWKKNVICGVIIAALLLLFGCYTFIFRPVIDDGADAYLSQTEQILGIDFPSSDICYLNTTGNYNSGNDRIFPLSRFHVSFSNYDQKALNAQLSADARWFTDIPYALLPCIPLSDANPDADYFLLFDVTTQTFNAIPTTPGTHTMLYITYYTAYGSLEILEYEYTCD